MLMSKLADHTPIIAQKCLMLASSQTKTQQLSSCITVEMALKLLMSVYKYSEATAILTSILAADYTETLNYMILAEAPTKSDSG